MKSLVSISLIGALALTLTAGCGGHFENTVRFEFESGFTGLIKIVETDDAPPLDKIDGEYVIRVPHSGLVEVPSLRQFDRGIRSGLRVPHPPGLAARRTEGGFDFLISPPEDIIWALVGTHEDHNFYHSNVELIEVHFEEQLADRQK